jgi:hypothetical protein
MKRAVQLILTFLSLLACAGAIFLWARSGSVTDCIDYSRASNGQMTLLSLYSWRGQLVLEHRREPVTAWNVKYTGLSLRHFPSAFVWTSEYLSTVRRQVSSWSTPAFWFARLQFEDTSGKGLPVPATARLFAVPDWLVVIAAALLPAAMLRKILLRRSRRAGGRCVNCGYDLRASTGRCPECGVAVQPGSR